MEEVLGLRVVKEDSVVGVEAEGHRGGAGGEEEGLEEERK